MNGSSLLDRPTVVVVTGLSGAGKTTALHALEDLGFFCVDNLPTVLAAQAVAACEEGAMTHVALGMDVRVGTFLAQTEGILAMLADGGRRDVDLIFLDASDEALLRRFNETRRPHPLNARGSKPNDRSGALAVLDGVHLERERLAPLRARATRVIDTTNLSVHHLRRAMIHQFGPASGGAARMQTRIISFGFKYGSPVDADLLLDVRFLENPHFIPELKALSGKDKACVDYVLGLEESDVFLDRTAKLLTYILPKYEREGKSYLTIGVGCTGGRHRSVAIADALQRVLAEELPFPITVVHRDIDREHHRAPLEEPDP